MNMWGLLRGLFRREAPLLSAPAPEDEMADELTISAVLDFANGNYKDRVEVLNLQLDNPGVQFVHQVQTVIAVETSLSTGVIAINNAWGIFINRNVTTGRIELRATSGGVALVRIPPGGVALFQIDVATIFAISPDSPGATELEYFIVEP